MAPELSLVSVSLATVGIESFFYGIFFILTTFSVYLLIIRQKTTSSRHSIFRVPFFYASVGIFLSVTAHWILTWIRLFDAFIHFNDGTTPVLYYADLRRITEVVKTGFLIATLVMCDAMVIYRLWVVWNYNKLVVIFPLCTLAGLIVCGIGITYQFSVFPLGADVFTSIAGRWITSDITFTICTNIYSSTFIAWRIWRINRSSRKFGVATLNSVLVTVVESAAVYTSWAIMFFATYLSKSNMQFFTIDTFPAIAGISFMLIMTRVGLGWAQKASGFTSGSVGRSTGVETNQSGAIALGNLGSRPLAVNISKTVNQDDGAYRVTPGGYGGEYTFKKSEE
ncbi:hypothetical protein CPC08DRAFT_667036 [Agrocybe pediades]|nr:hypothetical protein CPC08DRAFT_667036 [Agrocybe pediades]